MGRRTATKVMAHPVGPRALARRMLAAVPTVALLLLFAAGCDDRSAAGGDPSDHTSDHTSDPTNDQDYPMKIRITIGDETFGATLYGSAAARDLMAQLPVTVDMVDLGGVEKTGPLPAPLSLEGQPEGTDPNVGDVGYYAPGNDLVLYYGDQSYFPGIVVLGRMDGDAAERIAGMDGPVTASVEATWPRRRSS
jgi:hypothetical protein